MSDLSKRSDEAPDSPGLWLAIKKAARRLQDWFVIQSTAVKLTMLAVALLIPATGIYSFMLIQKQAAIAAQVKAMAVAGKAGEEVWTLNDKLPVVFGTGSLLSFLETNPVERITVVYDPLQWNVSERIILIESQGQALRVLPQRHGDQDLHRQGGHGAVGRQACLHPARRTQRRQQRIIRAPGPALCQCPSAIREGQLEGRRQRCVVGCAYARRAGLPVLPAQKPTQVAQVHRAGAGARLH